MNEKVNSKVVSVEEESIFDFKQLWKFFIHNWLWFVISVIACVFVAGLYLWFTPSTIVVTGKMEINWELVPFFRCKSSTNNLEKQIFWIKISKISCF